MQLRQAVDGVAEQLRRGVLAVPLFVELEFVEAEVGGGVDHGQAVAHVGRQPLGRRRVRQGGEDHVHIAFDIGHDRQVQRPEVREHLGQTLADLRTARHADDLHVGMLGQQTRQLGADVARDVDDRYTE